MVRNVHLVVSGGANSLRFIDLIDESVFILGVVGGIHPSAALGSDFLVKFSADSTFTVWILARAVFYPFVNAGSTSHKSTHAMSFCVYFNLDVYKTWSRTWSGNTHVRPLAYRTFLIVGLRSMMLGLSCSWWFVRSVVLFINCTPF